MTENYLDAFGGKYEAELDRIHIQWPGETQMHPTRFPHARDAATQNGIASARSSQSARDSLTLATFCAGHADPVAPLFVTPSQPHRLWSLWEISIVTQDRQKRRMLPLFVHDDGRMLAPTARFLWEQLCLEPWAVDQTPVAAMSEEVFRKTEALAHEQCRDLYLEMRQRHLSQLQLEKDKAELQFPCAAQTASGDWPARSPRFPFTPARPGTSSIGGGVQTTKPGHTPTHTAAHVEVSDHV